MSPKRIERSALVNYSVEQMYALVNDIEAYPQFMPGCAGAEILQKDEGFMEARLDLAKAGLRHSFVTRNSLVAPESISMTLVSGPFKEFRGRWQFTPLNENACKVHFWLEFEFANKLLALATSKLFEKLASEQVGAVCRRAQQLYNVK